MKYKIVFLDVDGTIFSHKTKSIPSSCIEAINKAKENGIIIIETDTKEKVIQNLNEEEKMKLSLEEGKTKWDELYFML